jgi:hypothetical protein
MDVGGFLRDFEPFRTASSDRGVSERPRRRDGVSATSRRRDGVSATSRRRDAIDATARESTDRVETAIRAGRTAVAVSEDPGDEGHHQPAVGRRRGGPRM